MEREIKFRFWLGHTKKMTISHSLQEIVKMNWDISKDITPMQYTGLKDKNGKGVELFDKDLIINYSRNLRKPHAIEWSNEFGAWIGNYHDTKYLISQELHEIEKVGTVHENPELLK